MGLASIGLYHIKCEESKRIRGERLKHIETCRQLSKHFWDCVARNRTKAECGPEYYNLIKCIEKLS